jgi:selenide,water dikinase
VRELVLVGAGHTHVQVLTALAQHKLSDVRITVVVDTPIAIYSGMLPGLVAGRYRRDELEIDARDLAKRCGARVHVEAAIAVEPQRRAIVLASGARIAYDIASFDIGSTVAGLATPGVREHAVPTRPIGRFIECLDERTRGAGPELRAVIVGAGAGGIELAFALRARMAGSATAADGDRGRSSASHDEAVTLPAQVAADARGRWNGITVIEAGPQILAGHPSRLVRRVEAHAAAAGIELRGNARVRAVHADAVELEGGACLPSELTLWVTGAAAHSLFRDSAIATDPRGFARIRPTLQLEEHEALFAAGDCATPITHPRTPKAGVYAVRQGPYLAHNLVAALRGEKLREYTPQSDFLTLLNLGDRRAIGAKWGRTIEGRWVMALKDWIDRRFVRRFQVSEG